VLTIAYELSTDGMTAAEREEFDAWLEHGHPVAAPPVTAGGLPASGAVAAINEAAPASGAMRSPVPDLDEMRRTWGKGPQAAAGLASLMGAEA
jgi:hypothetical protein